MRDIIRNICRSFVRRKVALIAIALIAVLVIPQSSESQILPSPCCAILSAGLGSIASAITNVIGGALSAINATMTSIEAFERTVVWPQNLINQARAVVGAVQGLFNQMRAVGQIRVASATLPNPQQLEQTLLSGNSGLMGSVGAQYAAVYSAVRLPT